MKATRLAAAVATFGAAIILAPAAALAAPDVQAEFTAMDKNADGFITGAEFVSTLDLALATTDLRKVRGPDGIAMFTPDGKWLKMRVVPDGQTAVAAPGEVVLTYAQSRQWTLNRYDIDGDGRLSLAEYRTQRIQGAATRFRLSDANADERLTLQEFVARLTANPPASASVEVMAAYERSTQRIVEDETARFKALDGDKDGFLSRVELTPA